MPSGDVLELYFVLYVPELTKSLLSVSYMTDLQCSLEFDGPQITIRDVHGSGQVLARGVREGGLYRLLADLVERVWQEAMMDECASSLEEPMT